MQFNSIEFLVFFPVVTAAYFALPQRFRWLLLLGASVLFYMAFVPAYILILAFTIGVDYAAGIAMAQAADQRRKRAYLVASLAANIGALAFFKYFGFVNSNLAALAHFLDWNYPLPLLQILLPIGLSFHTFQALSYTIEVYRGRQSAERHLGIYALYVMFYPQLVAGPIERPQNLIHQFREQHPFDYRQVTDGLKLMAWGFFKKLVIADRLAPIVNQVYGSPAEHSGVVLVQATLMFAFQIFCDFSGYSDIAIGAAQVMGFRLMKNFDRPYFSASLAEFWRRWHISLSSWFRDYVYIPLGGSRVSPPRRVLNLMLVFLLSGLWHGADWTFVVWGALHGLAMAAAVVSAPLRARLGAGLRIDAEWAPLKALRVAGTFGLVSFAWIFFRAQSVGDGLYIATHLADGWREALARHELGLIGSPRELEVAAAAIALMELVHLLQQQGSLRARIATKPAWLRWALYVGLVMAILILGRIYQAPTQFIYFQF